MASALHGGQPLSMRHQVGARLLCIVGEEIASQAPQSKEAALDTLKRLAATSDICYSQETLWFHLFRRAQGMQCRGSTPI